MFRPIAVAGVASAMFALGSFLLLLYAPLAGAVDPGLLLAMRVLGGLALLSTAGVSVCIRRSVAGVPQRRVAADPGRGEAAGDPPCERDPPLDAGATDRTAELAAANRWLKDALADVGAVQRNLVRRERLATLGSMVAGFAHELNTPIGNARVSASVLSREVRALKAAGVHDPVAIANRLERVAELLERSLGRAAELIATFKQVSVDQAGAQRRRFQLHDAMRALWDTVSPRMRQTSVALSIAIPVDIWLDSYPGPMEQAVYNLVNNAMVHAFDEGTVGTIEIRAECHGDSVRITVEDDGIGIPDDHQRVVFDPFFTTKMGSGGSGLGLHMVRTTVTSLLGGQVTLDSAPGRGTRVHLDIPTVAPVAGGRDPDQAGPTSNVTPCASGSSRP